MNLQTTFKLNNGIEIPALGLGTYLSKPGEQTYDAVLFALQHGYRHIDTAAFYKNETNVGKALRDSGLTREEVFITTKLWNDDQGYDKALAAFEKSLKNLDSDYIDLYLVHWPLKAHRKESWKALERIYDEKLVRSIGVSNYTINHINELLGYANYVPAVNQVEFSPFLYQKDLQEHCELNGILIQAYTPLTRGKRLKDDRLVEIASKYNKTTAQILIRWALEVHIIVLPKSVKSERIIENADIYDFEFADDDLRILNSMNENYRTSWDPTNEL